MRTKPKLRSLQLLNKSQLLPRLMPRLLTREKQTNPKKKNLKEYQDPKKRERLRLQTTRSEWQPKAKSKTISVTPSVS